jgi:hypothetical protein
MESLKQQLENLVHHLQHTTDETQMHQINTEMLSLIQAYITQQYSIVQYHEHHINIHNINLNDDKQLLGIIGILAEVDDIFADTIRPVFFECDEMEFWALMRELIEESSLTKS